MRKANARVSSIAAIFALALLAMPALAQPAEDAPHVVLVAGEEIRYGSEETLGRLGEFLESRLGMRYTLLTTGAREDIPGMEALQDADLAVFAIRRRALSYRHMRILQEYLGAGKPLLAIRTTSHAFDPTGAYDHLPDITDIGDETPGPDDPVAWRTFDQDVLGCNYDGYPRGATAIRMLAEAMDHPIMEGLEGPYVIPDTMYRSAPLADTATTLLMGAAIDGGRDDERLHLDPEADIADEPVAWINDYNGASIFYTSIGGFEAFDACWYQRMLLNAVFWLLETPAPDNIEALLEDF